MTLRVKGHTPTRTHDPQGPRPWPGEEVRHPGDPKLIIVGMRDGLDDWRVDWEPDDGDWEPDGTEQEDSDPPEDDLEGA
jgi:hypothetical protein